MAFLSTFVMGAYCLLLTNNMLLPRRIRPNIVISVILGFGAVFYLGLLFYSIFAYGARIRGIDASAASDIVDRAGLSSKLAIVR